MNQAASETSVDPRQCALLVCIPTQGTTFRQHLARDRGYIKGIAASAGWTARSADAAWSLYKSRIADPVSTAAKRAHALGAKVVTNALITDLGKSCRTHRVVTLFAHCEAAASSDSLVEFADDLIPLERVVAELPNSFAGVLDLALCNSWRLGESIKTQLPRCLVVMHARRVQPAFRAAFYRGVIEELALRPRRYTDVVVELAKEVLQ